MKRSYAGLLLCLPLLGCDSLHDPLINMTEQPILVEYTCCDHSATAKSTVSPKHALWLFGGPPFGLHLNSLTVTTSEGRAHRYSREDLKELRPRHTLEDRFGWFDDGLRYLKKSPRMKIGSGGVLITATFETSEPKRSEP